MKKSSKSPHGSHLSYNDFDHGHKINGGATPLEGHKHKPGHKAHNRHGGASTPQHTGYVDWANLEHHAGGHEKGHRGPFQHAAKGRHKAKD
jgi:hypothetical protein